MGYIARQLSEGEKVAVVNISAPSERLSDYVIEELAVQIANDGKLSVVDRRNLQVLQSEMNFQMSGEVSDETALSVGKKVGAAKIISGSITRVGSVYRFRLQTIDVETARLDGGWAANVRQDSKISALAGPPDENESPKSRRFSLGFGVEANLYTSEGFAVGGLVQADYAFTGKLAAGVRGAYFNNLDGLSTIEIAGFLRGYTGTGSARFFAQGDIGTAYIFDTLNSAGNFMIGASAGIRIGAGKFWFEPYIRAGYPFMAGAGILTGLSL
jgi:TolB-like protein